MDNRPRGREQHVTGAGKDIQRRGEGLGSGPVGNSGGRPTQGGGSGNRAGGGRSPLVTIILLAIALLGGGGVGLSGLLGGSPAETPAPQQSYSSQGSAASSYASGSNLSASDFSSLFGGYGGVSSGWDAGSNTGRLNTAVAAGARQKRTTILGSGQDTVTIMVYMCGTDLESKYGMGTSDLQEMMAASLSDKVNIIVYTGGCKQWKNNIVSNSVNEIYKVESGGLRRLAQDKSAPPMTDPNTLSGFIQYCVKNYPANRNDLIFWDHGGGSLSGYGYDEKNARYGSMSLAGIDQALKASGAVFDFIGFDACLMATLENALMLSKYGDYLIASEETEPGVGWFYTNWLTKLSANTSMSTLEIGKNIVDDFVDVCAQKCRGQDTTLSVVDLGELETTVPSAFRDWAVGTSQMVQGSGFQTVSNARSRTHEFAASSRIDQVDLVHLANRMNTNEGKAMNDALLSAVKYNRTSNTVSNAYGLSIYFPYQKSSKVPNAAKTYQAIGMDDEYTRCIQQFASMGTAGQTISGSVSGLSGSPMGSLLGSAIQGGSSSLAGSDMVSSILMSVLSAGFEGGRALDTERATEYLTENQFDSSQLVWLDHKLTLSEKQWGLVNDLALSVYYDDGSGYIDLGLDNVFSFTDDGALEEKYSGTWLAIDSQPVAYYHTSTVDDGEHYTISGYVPCLINGNRAELLLRFDNEHPYGYIAGSHMVYNSGETETVAKNSGELAEGDVIEFVCDYYSYGGEYRDSFLFGAPWTYHTDAEISDVTVNADRVSAMYRFTDIYGQHYWTPPMSK